MYIECKSNWLNQLDAALQKYNISVHGTTKMTPFEMSFCAASLAASHTAIPNPILNDKIKLPKFQVADFVRVPDKRSVYSKGSTNPVTNTLEHENKEIIQGKYYEQELFLRSVFQF